MDWRQEKLVPEGDLALLVIQQADLQPERTAASEVAVPVEMQAMSRVSQASEGIC